MYTGDLLHRGGDFFLFFGALVRWCGNGARHFGTRRVILVSGSSRLTLFPIASISVLCTRVPTRSLASFRTGLTRPRKLSVFRFPSPRLLRVIRKLRGSAVVREGKASCRQPVHKHGL